MQWRMTITNRIIIIIHANKAGSLHDPMLPIVSANFVNGEASFDMSLNCLNSYKQNMI